MSRAAGKRRSPGEGGAYLYVTGAGEQWRFKCIVTLPDGARKPVNRRGFPTKAAALRAMREAQSASDENRFTVPGRARLGDYGAEVIAGMRIKPQTRASYVKNWRCHVEPYAVAAVPLAQLTGARLTTHYRQLEKAGRKDYRAGRAMLRPVSAPRPNVQRILTTSGTQRHGPRILSMNWTDMLNEQVGGSRT